MAEQLQTKTKMNVKDLPQSQEIQSLLERLEKARTLLSPEDRESIQELDSLKREAKQMYAEKADRADWLSLAETIGRSLVKLGAAQEGLSSGADISKMQMEPATDFESRLDRARQSYTSEAQDIASQKKGIVDVAKERQSGEIKNIEARLNEANKLRTYEASQEGIGGVQKRDRIQTTTRRNPITGKNELVERNIDTGEEIVLGEHGYSPNIRKDPYTGELIEIIPGEGATSLRGQSRPNIPTSSQSGGSQDQYNQLNPNQRKLADDLMNKFASETDDSRNALDEMAGMDSALATAQVSEQGTTSLRRRVARVLEKGKLSDNDVSSAIGRQSVVSRLTDYVNVLTTGTISPEQAADMKIALDDYQKTLGMSVNKRALEKAKLYKTRFGMDPEKIAPLIYGDYDPNWASTKSKSTAAPEFSESDIESIMKQYPKLTREKAIKGLQMQKAADEKAKTIGKGK